MSYNTGNPVPSNDARDYIDNVEFLDALCNSDADRVNDRLGEYRMTARGMENYVRDLGFKPAGFDFVTGGTLSAGDRNLAVYNPAPAGDGNWYSWSGDLPKTVSPGENPLLNALWAPRTDDLLRAELSSAAGASAIGTSSGANVQDVINNLVSRSDFDDARFTELYGANGSIRIGHDQGVGGSPRNVRAVLRDRFNIADFKVNTDSDWTNAFQRAASSGETVSVYCKDVLPGLFSPIIIDSPVTFYCEGGFRQSIAKGHGGSMFDIRSSGVNISDMLVYNDEALGAGGRVILLDTAVAALENIRLKNIHQSGGSQAFITDSGSGSPGLIVDLLLEDIKLNGLNANAIALTRAFAYIDMKKVTVNYVPSSSKAFIGISISGNEGCNLEWCHVNHGISVATPNSYGFVFSNSKAIWMDRCQADTCGVDGFRFDNCQYVYGNQLSASLCGGDGITMSGSDITIGNSYFGGRRGLTYQGISGSALVRSTASKAFLNGCNLSNGGFNGFAASASTVLSGGGIFNTVTPYAISGSAKLRQVMNDGGTLVDAG